MKTRGNYQVKKKNMKFEIHSYCNIQCNLKFNVSLNGQLKGSLFYYKLLVSKGKTTSVHLGKCTEMKRIIP